MEKICQLHAPVSLLPGRKPPVPTGWEAGRAPEQVRNRSHIPRSSSRTLVSILPELSALLEGSRWIEEILPYRGCCHGNDHYDPQIEFRRFVAIRVSNMSADCNKTKRSTQGVSGSLSLQPDGVLSYCYSPESTCLGNRWGRGCKL
jgi:hypothetical protein